MRLRQRGGQAIALCGLLLLLISGAVASGAAVTDRSALITNAADGEPFQPPADPLHVWVAGDVFSLHGVDQYRYIVVYTRDTADGLVHGCYEVEQEPSGRYVVTQYVHGQEVFGDAFITEQGGRFIQNIPLDSVVITDDTPVDGGRTYYGVTLGSIYGAANAPVATSTPEPVPTSALWPSIATQAPSKTARPTTAPTTSPTGVVSVTRTPGPDPTLPSDAQPFPMPTVNPAAPLPTVTVTEQPTSAPGSAVLDPAPEPTVTSSSSRVWGKRFASWQAPSLTSRRTGAAVVVEPTTAIGGKTTRIGSKAFGRFYPPWYRFQRAAL